jgi:hypothetical protein
MNPIFSHIKPLNQGKVYAQRHKYSQSYHKLDEIFKEIAAILHPDVYSDNTLEYFIELPEKDPKQPEGLHASGR